MRLSIAWGPKSRESSVKSSIMTKQYTTDEAVAEALSREAFLESPSHSIIRERATRHFYTCFKEAHHTLLAHIYGLANANERERYASLMLSRLIFLYFIQQQGFLDNDTNYLSNRLHMTSDSPKPDTFYRLFLLPLFHRGLSVADRPPDLRVLLGSVPHLGGDLFATHEIERLHPDLDIANRAFSSIFASFAQHRWTLHEHLLQHDNDITPAVLGYILEQFVNQEQMGAYYTREDVTAYIARNTIIPALFDTIADLYPAAFQPCASIWRHLRTMPARYIYRAVSSEALLPGESAHEYRERYSRHIALCTRLRAGEIHKIDDLVTYNLNIYQFAQDVIYTLNDPRLLYAFYNGLQSLTILDPTCGSGAFLFAALNILEPLYIACLERMQTLAHEGIWSDELAAILQQAQMHINRRYFVRKAIIMQNLYGVDLMEQAITTCKLRLSLALIACIENSTDIEPLPNFTAHLRTGNALIGHSMQMTDRAPAQDRTECDAQIKTSTLQPLQQPFNWGSAFADVLQQGGFSVIIGNPPYVEYDHKSFPYQLRDFTTLACTNLYPCMVERSQQLLSTRGRTGMILPLAAFATRNMIPLLNGFLRWFPCSWLSFYHFRPSMLFSGSKSANIPTAIYLAKPYGAEQRFSTRLNKWSTEHRDRLFTQLSYCQVTTARDAENFHYYAKFGQELENSIMQKVLRHTCVKHYLAATASDNTIYYRSAGGLYWKVFLNFPWPYQTTSNKQRSFQDTYDRDIFVALFNSSLFWWYYTVTFDTFNVKDYMLFGFRFSYPQDTCIIAALRVCCQQLMENFRAHARHLKRGSTGSYTIYARKAKTIIDEVDRILAQHYGFSQEEVDFILNYDIKYRVGDGSKTSD